MRTFVAIDLPEEVRTRIHAMMDSLRTAAPGLRWSRPEGLHITLKFIGQTPESQVDEVARRLSEIRDIRPFSIRIRGSGWYPNPKRPRVLWLGVEAGPELAQLAGEVDSELARMNIPAEERAYSPHLTLARNDGNDVKRLSERITNLGVIDLGAFTVNQYFLYESELSAGGSIYTKLRGFALPTPQTNQP